MIADRINKMSESATLAMTRKSRELQNEGYDVINLSIGEPDFNTPEIVKDAAKEAIDNNITHYPPVPGFEDLRIAVCKKFKRDNNLDFTPDQIVVSTGAKQSICNVILSIVNPEDEVIVPTPYWVSYKEMIGLAEGKMVNITTPIENDFKVIPDQIEAAITDKTKAIMLNSPSNPTGSVYTYEEMKAIADVLEKYPNIVIISDEIYEHIIFEGKHESFAQFENIKDRVAVVNGVSKGFAMTGWRLGVVAAPRIIASACNKIQGQITSGTCSISQMAAIEAFLQDPKTMDDMLKMREAFRKRRDIMIRMLGEVKGLKINIPKGAFYIFSDVTDLFNKRTDKYIIENSSDLCMYLLKKANVALVPGEAFGDPNCIRFSYAASEDKLAEAVSRIRIALSELE